jgi:ribosomal protein S13|tara:strand:- start:28 stop:237 length:210 start_codon:yes stop_codon:yes gene_type:complete
MRSHIRSAMIEHAKGHIAKHKMNVEIYLQNAVGVGNENSTDVLEAIEKELNIVAMYDDQIEMLKKYFKE